MIFRFCFCFDDICEEEVVVVEVGVLVVVEFVEGLVEGDLGVGFFCEVVLEWLVEVGWGVLLVVFEGVLFVFLFFMFIGLLCLGFVFVRDCCCFCGEFMVVIV